MKNDITVIIPTYRPGKELTELLRRLRLQTVSPERILIVNTEEALFREELVENWDGISVLHIEKSQFDHARTRDMAARMCGSEFLLFMTMDALPADRSLIRRLLEAFRDEKTAVAYARQLPKKDARKLERYVRSFNYPEQSIVKSAEDVPEMGVKAYFCSNVCAMYRRDRYLELGGFVWPAIFNEDMVFAGTAVQHGYRIAYCASARVYHSHDYSVWRQLRRNFDLGVSQQQHPEIFDGVPSEGSGVKMIREVSGQMMRDGNLLQVPLLIWQSGWKYAGYLLGRRYEHLPAAWIGRLTMNPEFWKAEREARNSP